MTDQKATAILQARNDAGLGQCGYGRKKKSSGQFSKLDMTGFADTLLHVTGESRSQG